jgi:hypothetical protein
MTFSHQLFEHTWIVHTHSGGTLYQGLNDQSGHRLSSQFLIKAFKAAG